MDNDEDIMKTTGVGKHGYPWVGLIFMDTTALYKGMMMVIKKYFTSSYPHHDKYVLLLANLLAFYREPTCI